MGHVIGIDTTYTGNPVSFNAAQGGTMKSIVVPFTYTQDLHGYAKPWPGGGGVNKWDEVWEQGSIDNSTGKNKAASTGIRCKNYIPVVAGESYYICNLDTANSIRYYYYDASYVFVSSANVNNSVLTIPSGVFYLRIRSTGTYGDVYKNDWSVNYPATATEYSPYANICPISGLTDLSVYVGPTQDPDDATVYNVDWTTQAGTVYSGTVDVVTGQLTLNRASVDLGSILWTYQSGYTYPYFQGNMPTNCVSGSDAPGQVSVVCSAYESVQNISAASFRTANYNYQCCLNSAVATKRLLVQNPDYTDAETFTTAMSGVQLVYELSTPITYWITPKQIATLIGQNYIWSSNNETLNTVLTAPATGFAGWLIKCVTNGTPVEIPLKYMRAETYTVTPDQRMEWSAERDVTGVLHRETVQNLPPKIEFNTPLMTNSEINALNSIIKAAFTSYLQRNITIQFYDPERDEYWEWDCYMPDVKYHIRNADTANNIINYEELRYAFIGY